MRSPIGPAACQEAQAAAGGGARGWEVQLYTDSALQASCGHCLAARRRLCQIPEGVLAAGTDSYWNWTLRNDMSAGSIQRRAPPMLMGAPGETLNLK